MTTKYTKTINKIIDYLGGMSNIENITHCATRLRFVLHDENLAKTDELQEIPEVITVVQSGGQYQVVVGTDVKQYFSELEKIRSGNIETNKMTKVKNNKSVVSKIVDFMAGIFYPIFNFMAACGILKGLLAIVVLISPSLREQGIYQIFNGLADSLFLFLPIFLGYTTANKVGIPPLLGVLIGSALCYPDINGVDLNLLGTTLNVTYTSSFLPIVLILLFAKPIYSFFDRFTPDLIKSFMAPLLTMMVIFPIGFSIIGPFSNFLATIISNLILSLYNFNGILAGIIIGVLWQVLVVFGLHGVLISVVIVNLFNGQGDLILAVSIFVAFAQTATIAAIGLKTKQESLKKKISPAVISGIFGITEPAIYGITLPRLKMFVTSCISGGIAGALCGFLNIKKYATGSGIFAIPTMINPEHPEISSTLTVLLSTIIISFVLAFLVYRDSDYEGI